MYYRYAPANKMSTIDTEYEWMNEYFARPYRMQTLRDDIYIVKTDVSNTIEL